MAPAVEESDEEDDGEELEEVEMPKAKAKEVKKAGKKVQEKEEKETDSSEDEEDVHLHGFSTDEDSSDDENAMDQDEAGFDVGKLPTVAKDDSTVKAKLDKAKKKPVS